MACVCVCTGLNNHTTRFIITVWTRERPPVRVQGAVCKKRLNSAHLGLDPPWDGQLAEGRGQLRLWLRRAAASACARGVSHMTRAMWRRRTAVRLRTGGSDGADGDVAAEGVGGAPAEAPPAPRRLRRPRCPLRAMQCTPAAPLVWDEADSFRRQPRGDINNVVQYGFIVAAPLQPPRRQSRRRHRAAVHHTAATRTTATRAVVAARVADLPASTPPLPS